MTHVVPKARTLHFHNLCTKLCKGQGRMRPCEVTGKIENSHTFEELRGIHCHGSFLSSSDTEVSAGQLTGKPTPRNEGVFLLPRKIPTGCTRCNGGRGHGFL